MSVCLKEGVCVVENRSRRLSCILKGEWETPGTQLDWAGRCVQSNERHNEDLKTQCDSEMRLSWEFSACREGCKKEVGFEELEEFER